ncbi:MAG: DNA mismatch repair protein MutS [Chitinophagales bacterium]|nr:DNA mismatch repair protein MutS [Chitinophagales bacterium]MDW8418073.1 DNA mismatch repair protein MutS [Chitinophagales bacterium]
MSLFPTLTAKPENDTETPLMKQYNSFKAKYPDAVLLFRVGDFYETFDEDARIASSVLGIVLTKRSNGKASEVDLAGFPHHALDTYLPKLVRAGYRVAVCDQIEDPKLAKGIVKRAVTEMVTPGVALTDNILQTKNNNFLASLYAERDWYGLALIDISTGEFLMAEGKISYIDKLLQSLSPAEVLYPRSRYKDFEQQFGNRYYSYKLDDWIYTYEHGLETLLKLFGTNSLKGFGIEEEHAGIIAAGAAIQYLKDTEHHQLSHITKITKLCDGEYVWLDRFTIRNLEMVQANHPGGKSLLEVLDHTTTPMGARLLRRWLVMPLNDLQKISERQSAVEYFVLHRDEADALKAILRQVGDLERLTSKISLEKINPREMLQLRRALMTVPQIRQTLHATGNPALDALSRNLYDTTPLTDKIYREVADDASPVIAKGNFIKSGFHPELDELRTIKNAGKEYISHIQIKEQQRTGITSLKVGFNNVFGYYLEVTNTHKHKVPPEWIRKQTLANAERYITEELKEYEQKVLGAEEKIQHLEEQIFRALIVFAKDYVLTIQKNAGALAYLDALLSLADAAVKYQYCKPEVNDTYRIDIREGRHPVIERQLPAGEAYVANDVLLDADTHQILIITGPNMSGKSALLRQTALIVLMAQIGSFVPAASASIGLVDKIFTRVGASDNLSAGESTFMVEMNETASIMNNLSPRSLILLDEIGRGTSTYDGISIAWSIAEYLHQHSHAHPRTLFATHYHELNELAELYPRIHNFHVSVKEAGNKVIFLRKLVEGGTEHSFGIHVARMAGMPAEIIARAENMLRELESQRGHRQDDKPATKDSATRHYQLHLFDLNDPLIKKFAEELEKTEINSLSPIEALMKLHEWKKMLSEKK